MRKNGKGMGSIYYHKASKTYAGQYVLEGKKHTIYQRKNESVTDFRRRFNELINQINNDTYLERNNSSLDYLVSNYIEQRYNDGYVLPNTYLRNKETLKLIRKLCQPFWYKPVQKVSPRDIEESKSKMRQYSASTISKMWVLLNKGFQIAINRRIISYNIMNDETIQKPLPIKEKEPISALSVEEEKKLRKALKKENTLNAKACLIQLNTGMRIGEVLARNINDIDFQEQVLHINNTMTVDENKNAIVGKHTKIYSKTNNIDKGTRTIPLDSETLLVFKSMIKTLPINGYFFYRPHTKSFIDPKRMSDYLERLNKRYDICSSKLTSHRLRHTKITRLQEAGVNLVVIQRMVGHVEGSNMTNDVYTDVSTDFMRQEINKIS